MIGEGDGRAATSGGASADTPPPIKEMPINGIRFNGGLMVSRKRRRLELVLANRNLADVQAQYYVLGLFDGVAPGGAARPLDLRTNGLISDFVSRHLLDGAFGKVSLLPTSCTALPTELIAFIGLGHPGDFTVELQKASAAAVVRALARLRIHEFATVLMGDSMSQGDGDAGPS